MKIEPATLELGWKLVAHSSATLMMLTEADGSES
jgi:hypothetical protein